MDTEGRWTNVGLVRMWYARGMKVKKILEITGMTRNRLYYLLRSKRPFTKKKA